MRNRLIQALFTSPLKAHFTIALKALSGLLLVMNSSGVHSDVAVNYPPVDANVAYSSVVALPFAEADAKISYGIDPNQYGLLWRARTSVKPKPLVVFIHGGCWLSNYDIAHSRALTTAIAQAGFPVWSLEYRRSGATGGGWPTTMNDIKQGLVQALQLPDIDAKHLIIVGHSAGGHLALMAAGKKQQLRELANVRVSIIGLAAITDVEGYSRGSNSCQTATPAFFGGSYEQQTNQYDAANPSKAQLHYPTYLLQGDSDNIVPMTQASHPNAETRLQAGAGHFDWVHPGTPAVAELLKLLEDLSTQ